MTDSLKWSRKENHGWLKTLANQTSLKWLRKENHGWLKTLANQKLEELLDLIFKPGIVWFNEVMFGTVKGERLSRLVVAEGFKLFRLVGAAGFKYQDDRRSLLEPIKIHFNIHETTIHSGVDSIVPDGVNTLVRTALDSVFTLREEPPYREQYDGMLMARDKFMRENHNIPGDSAGAAFEAHMTSRPWPTASQSTFREHLQGLAANGNKTAKQIAPMTKKDRLKQAFKNRERKTKW